MDFFLHRTILFHISILFNLGTCSISYIIIDELGKQKTS